MRVWLTVLSLIVAVMVAANASAAEKKGGRKKEAKQSVEERFKKMDTSNDGTLSQDEFVAAHKKMGEDKAKGLFEKMGGTKDKGLTLEQYTKAVKEWKGKHGEHKKGEKKEKK